MKFECDSCHAQYMIADEKLGTRGVKVKCKRCSHVIIVRPVATSDAAAADTAERPRDTFVERAPNATSPDNDDDAGHGAGADAFGSFGDDLDDEPTRATFDADTEVAAAESFSDTIAGAASEPRPAAAPEESTVVGPAPTLAALDDGGLPADEDNPFLKKAQPAAPDFGALAGDDDDDAENPFQGLGDLDGGDDDDDGATHADGHPAYRAAAQHDDKGDGHSAGASADEEQASLDDDAGRAADDDAADENDGSLRMDSELDADPFFGDGGGDSDDEPDAPPPEAPSYADMSGADVPPPPPPDALPAMATDEGASSMPDVGGGDDLLEGELMGAFGAMFASADEGGAERGPTQVLDLGRVDQLRAESQRSEVGGPFGSGDVHSGLDQDFVGLGGQTLEGPALGSDSQLDEDEGGWHAAIDDEDVGPLTLREMGEHIKTGGVDRETLVWRPGMEDWTAAGEVREVRPLFDAVPMPKIAPSGEGAASFDVGAPIDDMGPSPFSSGEGRAEGPDPFGPIAGFDTDDNDGAWQPHGLTEVYQAANLAEAAGGLGGGSGPQSSSPGLSSPSLDDDDDDAGWKPGAGSALASLVSSEIERLDTPGFGESSLPPAADDSLSLNLDSSPLAALSSGGLDLSDDGPVGVGFGDVPTAPVPGLSGSLPPQPSLAGMPMAPYGAMPQSGLKNPLVLIAGVGGTVILLLFVVVLLLVFRDPTGPVVAQAPAGAAAAAVPTAEGAAASGVVEPAAAANAAAATAEPAAAQEPAAAAEEKTPDPAPEAAADTATPEKEPAAKADEPKAEKPPTRVAAAQKRPEKRVERRVQRRQQPRQREQPKPRVQQVRRTRDCDPVLDLDCDEKPLRSASARSQKSELTPSDVLSVIKRNLRSVNACSAQHQAKGTLKMEWRILKSGNTSSVRVATPKFANTPVGDCVERAIKRWKFPAFSGKPPPPVKFPFKLKG